MRAATEGRPIYFPEPTVDDRRWGRYRDAGRQVDWLDRSTLTQAIRIREFLNRSLGALPADAAANLAHRFRHDPPFGSVFFETIVGRFLQVLGATVDHQPIGVAGVNVDWRATFPDGVIYVEATSPAYNQAAAVERRRREALVGVIEAETPPGWWVAPRELPKLPLGGSRRGFRRAVHSLFATLPDPAGYSIDKRIHLETLTDHGPLALEVWPGKDGKPTQSPIAFVSMGAHVDDSSLRVALAARAKRHQARAFPGEVVLLAIDAPFDGPDVESYDAALFGSTVMHLDLDGGIAGHSFRGDGALATQRQAEYAGVLAFPRVGMFGAIDPIVYRHPRFGGVLPGRFDDLRFRLLADGVRDVPARKIGIVDAIGFPVAADDD
jgi:hypothetical protein